MYRPVVPVQEAWCQTLVDDDGLWDIQVSSHIYIDRAGILLMQRCGVVMSQDFELL